MRGCEPVIIVEALQVQPAAGDFKQQIVARLPLDFACPAPATRLTVPRSPETGPS